MLITIDKLMYLRGISSQWLLLLLLPLWMGCQNSSTLFVEVSANKSGINFNNQITTSDSFNILLHEGLYNGGGIGVGDFNNDGLDDLYFTGNQVDNQLYINRGEFRFDDVTTEAGVASSSKWSAGVAVVDVNNDGLLDIYVCNTTSTINEHRVNDLYINQGVGENGIPVFKEMAEAYGLADDFYTVNSAFFDYDNDGDLDVYIIVNEMGDPRSASNYRSTTQRKEAYQRVDKLYQCSFDERLGHPVYRDVSKEAGIEVSGFSLGLNISDINGDGWKDIYVSNDFISNDALYINNQDGTFTDKSRTYFKHTSHSAMGSDVVDINNDGYNEVVVLDMLPEGNYRQKKLMGPINYSSYINNERYDYIYQYVRNTLQLNPGIEENQEWAFSEIALTAGISATDWSWTPLVADFDADGYRDIIVTNGFPKDVTDRDYMDYKADAARFVSMDQMLAKIPSVEIPNYAFKNNGDLTFSDVSVDWGLTQPTYSNGAVYADLDNDGDLDVVVNNIDRPATVLKNTKINSETNIELSILLRGADNNIDAIGSKVMAYAGSEVFVHEQSPFRGYLSTQTQKIHFGLGSRTIDSLKVIWPDNTICKLDSGFDVPLLEIFYKDCQSVGRINSKRQETSLFSNPEIITKHLESDFIDYNIQPLLPYKLSQYGPGMAVGDVNGDGLEDVYVSGPAFTHGYFLMQDTKGGFAIDTLRATNENKEELGSLLLDIDNDGDQDLYIVSGSYEFNDGDSLLQDQLLINENGRMVDASHRLPEILGNGLSAKAADYDKDGDLDIFVAGLISSGKFPQPVSSYLLINNSTVGDVQFDLLQPDAFINLGMVSDALWTDYNDDGWIDLIIARAFDPILILENNKGTFSKQEVHSEKKGFWTSIAAGDIDNDGDQDYILGNRGHNVFNEISETYPYRIYSKDFDRNGKVDAVPMAYFKGVDGEMDLFPTVSRMDFAKEINSIRKKYPTYEAYANLTEGILFTDSTLAKTKIYEVNYLSSAVLINNGLSGFDIHELNSEAQVAPIFGMHVEDYDMDGNLDIAIVGNDHGNELIFGRMDALNGLLLKGNGDGTFESTSIAESGLYIPGDGKSLVHVNGNDSIYLVAGENMGAIRKFTGSVHRNVVNFNPDEYKAVVNLEDGSQVLRTAHYGSGFISQSSRSFCIPSSAIGVTFTSYTGGERSIEIE